ncbi:hypothetical protein N7G274_006038 [Stereocaulon virgatum]|uniref:Uncharacterized protein n=1 Tax=Stereocaulon virgatum TaxID=373712 RepID=A0ABR4A6G5_9LECA
MSNAFTTVDHAVSDAQVKLNAQIRELESQMAAVDDQDWAKLYSLKNEIPLWTMLEEKEAVFRWVEEQVEGIR